MISVMGYGFQGQGQGELWSRPLAVASGVGGASRPCHFFIQTVFPRSPLGDGDAVVALFACVTIFLSLPGPQMAR